ncbi:hypothetical protein B0H16DRAFT_1699221 [Mycena metata]|uniref:Uncharacterized protein n=1 Tax=Mycena metata TaxID=1033252 RepID=A0AAD7HKI3_9AGAR|nr:hypothetical protein B0H16DRAFT_1699221 [Mycena metata]
MHCWSLSDPHPRRSQEIYNTGKGVSSSRKSECPGKRIRERGIQNWRVKPRTGRRALEREQLTLNGTKCPRGVPFTTSDAACASRMRAVFLRGWKPSGGELAVAYALQRPDRALRARVGPGAKIAERRGGDLRELEGRGGQRVSGSGLQRVRMSFALSRTRCTAAIWDGGRWAEPGVSDSGPAPNGGVVASGRRVWEMTVNGLLISGRGRRTVEGLHGGGFEGRMSHGEAVPPIFVKTGWSFGSKLERSPGPECRHHSRSRRMPLSSTLILIGVHSSTTLPAVFPLMHDFLFPPFPTPRFDPDAREFDLPMPQRRVDEGTARFQRKFGGGKGGPDVE